MLNFGVQNLSEAIAELTSAAIQSSELVQMQGICQFTRIRDAENNPIELWQTAQV